MDPLRAPGTGPTPLGRRIYEALRTQIRTGAYRPGEKLPSTRAFADEWGVSRSTVIAAYDQLTAEGYIESRPGARAQVTAGLMQGSGRSQTALHPEAVTRLSAFGRRLPSFDLSFLADPKRLVADFRYGDMASSDFPSLSWKQAIGAASLRKPLRLRYGDPAGLPELRKALQGYLWRARGLRCGLDQIIVVNGSQQGLDLCARLLLDPGDRVVIEDPCYHLARQVFDAAGVRPVPRPVDREGMRTANLPAARMAYVTPSHQFPLGSIMSAARRQELLAWSQANDAYVIEDDYDSEYRFDSGPVPPLQALSEDENVIYLGTVSKTLSPVLRLGYLVVPTGLRDAFAQAKRLTDRHSPGLEQEALTELIESGRYERHIRRVRRRNGERRAALIDALARFMPGETELVGTEAGLHVVGWLRGVPGDREQAFCDEARSAGLGLYPIRPLYDPVAHATRPDCAGLVLGYAGLSTQDIDKGVELLAQLIKRR